MQIKKLRRICNHRSFFICTLHYLFSIKFPLTLPPALAVGSVKPEMREKAAAERFFERLFHNISQITIAEMKGKQIEISLGACFCEVSEEVSFDQLYRKADRAMYQSKKKQGYSASIYEEWMKSN